ncbi:MAG: DUF368 domain-containing protein [Bacteroidetes bacterium CG12_big_fil_rev_8_21_14_0_65_60_17]|nr:MAG: DUF368 domain-containing protein [Bacteroidetes bacterium CG12_big_fil_rev_8_21_14_0_65_60_17]
MWRWAGHVLEGIAIGAANVIPGVSGGTMALLFGIYDRLIGVLGDLFRAGLDLVRLDTGSFRERLTSIPWGFVSAIGAGVLIAPVAGAQLIPDALDRWPELSRSLFFGLILGSLPIPLLRIADRRSMLLAWVVAGAILAWYLVGLQPLELENPSLVAYFLAGAVAICAMILPGVSGAFLLLVLGMYKPLFEAIEATNLPVIAVFGLGAGLGLGSFAILLKWLLARYHDATMSLLVGLMAGSLRSLWPWLADEGSVLFPAWTADIWPVILWGLVGLVIAGGMTVWEIRRSP